MEPQHQEQSYAGPIVDTFVEHAWSSDAAIAEYLPAAWREYLGKPGRYPDGAGMMALTPVSPFTHPLGDRLPDAAGPDGAPAGSSVRTTAAQLLDRHAISRAVLGHSETTRSLPGHLNHHFARELIRASNDWTVEQWLSGQDDRLHGLILVQNQIPEVAAAEIRRLADNPRMVGVLLGGNGLGKPFGHEVYDPIHRAAAEHGLPLVIPAGTDLPVDVLSAATAGGTVTTYAESHMHAHQSLSTHIVSLIVQGVFVRYPTLKVLVVGGGFSWALGVLWRLDNEFRSFRREVPWLSRQPGDYLLDHVRISTWPLEGYPTREKWENVFGANPEIARLACYASGYPSWDFNSPGDVAAALPDRFHAPVMAGNALDLYRWPDAGAAVSATGAAASEKE